MKSDVRQIRKNIAKRKREKSVMKHSPKTIQTAAFPQDEEKHGYLPFSAEGSSSNQGIKDTFIASLVMKSILSAILFFGVAIFLQVDAGWLQKPKEWTSNALTEEFPFATVNHWYHEKFGAPLALTPQQEETNDEGLALPVNGTITETFQMNGQGIIISANEKSEVYAMDKGTVIFAGNLPDTNKTVIVQHKDKSNTIYGNLTSINVHLYQFISDNEVIGEFVPSESDAQHVFFAIEKDNQYIDPVQVMQVDDRP